MRFEIRFCWHDVLRVCVFLFGSQIAGFSWRDTRRRLLILGGNHVTEIKHFVLCFNPRYLRYVNRNRARAVRCSGSSVYPRFLSPLLVNWLVYANGTEDVSSLSRHSKSVTCFELELLSHGACDSIRHEGTWKVSASPAIRIRYFSAKGSAIPEQNGVAGRIKLVNAILENRGALSLLKSPSQSRDPNQNFLLPETRLYMKDMGIYFKLIQVSHELREWNAKVLEKLTNGESRERVGHVMTMWFHTILKWYNKSPPWTVIW